MSRMPEAISPESDPCELAARWGVSNVLMAAVRAMTYELPFGLQIISGFRTAEEQAALREGGRPAAPDDLSTHRSCPATGIDLWPDVEATRAVRAIFGAAALKQGLRWGGGSPVDPDTGIPSDWNHLDMGPRRIG